VKIPKERIQRVSRVLHARGIEMTPDEILIDLKAATATIREALVNRGWQWARDLDDMAILDLCRAAEAGEEEKKA